MVNANFSKLQKMVITRVQNLAKQRQWSSPVFARFGLSQPQKKRSSWFLPLLNEENGHHQPNRKPKKMVITNLSKPQNWSLPGLFTLQSKWSSALLANLSKWSSPGFLPLQNEEYGHNQPNSKPKKMVITSLNKPWKMVISTLSKPQ